MNLNITSKIKFFSFLILFFFIVFACKKEKKKEVVNSVKTTEKPSPFFKLSLAQWSLHKYVLDEKKSPFHFASQSKALGFEGLEYVSQLYKGEIEKLGFDVVIDSLKEDRVID